MCFLLPGILKITNAVETHWPEVYGLSCIHLSHSYRILFPKDILTCYSCSNHCVQRMHALGKTYAFSTDIEVLVCFVVYKTSFYVFMLPGSDQS